MADSVRDGEDQTRYLGEGEAGFWLGESLIMTLVRARVIGKEQVVEAIELAIAAKQSATEEDHAPEIRRAAIAALRTLAASIAALDQLRDDDER